MPVHQFVVDRHLVERKLTNYWGYNSIGYFAPDVRYASSGNLGQQVVEFNSMVKALHRAGIEVILDVVYTIVPRLSLGLRGDWGDTTVHLPAGNWQNTLTGEPVSGGRVRSGELLKHFPVALPCKAP